MDNLRAWHPRFSFALFTVLCVCNPWCLNAVAKPTDCGILESVIPQCQCESAVPNASWIVINCQRKGLTQVPVINGSYSGLIYKFTLENNQIQSLPAAAFSGLRIQHLLVTQNKLNNVSSEAFQGLENDLESLTFGGDSSAPMELPFSAFTTLVNLTKLELDNFRVQNNHLDGPHILARLTKLFELKMAFCGIQSIASDFFTQVASTLTILRLSNNNFVSIPLDSLRQLVNLETLELKNDNLPAVSSYAFELHTKLKTLDLSFNKITQLESNCFKGLENTLESLSLDRNTFGTLSALDRIADLRGLKSLHLERALLPDLPPDPVFLRNKTGLQHLYLAGNKMKQLRSGTFASVLNTLTKLTLGENEISSMDRNVFASMVNLQSLHMDNMAIQQPLILPSFTHLTALTHLDLSNTNLSIAESWQEIGKLKKVEVLVLQKTGLSHIQDYVFSDLTHLQKIYLDNNGITRITQESFHGPSSSLTYISLMNNAIQSFDQCVFHNYTIKMTLSLIGNPLRCDCELKWFAQALSTGKLTLELGMETCDSPPDKNGQRLTDVAVSDFICTNGSTAAPDPVCRDLYTTPAPTTTEGPTTTPATTTSTLPPTTITITITSVNDKSMTVYWAASDLSYLKAFKVEHMDLADSQRIFSNELPTSTQYYTIQNLQAGHMYQVCVIAIKINNRQDRECTTKQAEGGQVITTPGTGQSNQKPQDIGVIVGPIVAGVVLLILLVLIVYLFLVRKKKRNADLPPVPVQPRMFTRSELPQMGYDSKRFRKAKRTENNNVTADDIQVSVISSGTAENGNMGRVSAGSYQYLDEKSRAAQSHGRQAPNSSASRSYVNDRSNYANDNDFRPLPHVPPGYQERNVAGILNPAFRTSYEDQQEPHPYQEINI